MWAAQRGRSHEFGTTACVAPIYGEPSAVDLRTWLILNLQKHVDRFALYVRTESFEHVSEALAWYIESRLVTLHDAGPTRTMAAAARQQRRHGRWHGGVDWRNNSERYNEADRQLHAEYEDQVLLLASCHHTYGYNSRRMLSLDLDEVLIGDALSVEHAADATGARPLLVPKVAYGAASAAACAARDTRVPFVEIFTRRQRHSIPTQLAWPRTKLLSSPRRISLQWIHGIFDPADACDTPARATEASLRIAHFVDLRAGPAFNRIHSGDCRCSQMNPLLPCDVFDASLAVAIAAPPSSVRAAPHRYLTYVETDGLNNQLVALRHTCWLAALTDRTVVTPDWLLHHLESDSAPRTRAALCDAIDCQLLQKECRPVSHSAFSALVPGGAALQKCGGAACFEPTDAEVLHLPDKTAFQLGLKKESWSFSGMVVARGLRNAVIPSKSVRLLAEARYSTMRSPVVALHARYVGKADYYIYGESTSTRLSSMLHDAKFALSRLPPSAATVIISNNCTAMIKALSSLAGRGREVMCAASESTMHPAIDCLVQQWFAVLADAFAADKYSTVSQNILHWRDWHDAERRNISSMICSPVWCSGTLSPPRT
jgi:hypothetical protein